MRLWHKDLIQVLPKQQLLGQWRELSAISSRLRLTGNPNHILVNPIKEYSLNHFITYADLVRTEMIKRGYTVSKSVFDNIMKLFHDTDYQEISYDKLYNNWMTSKYLTICYWNLFEKYWMGGISFDDWVKIDNLYKMKGLNA